MGKSGKFRSILKSGKRNGADAGVLPGNLTTFKDESGRQCIGNACFHVRADGKDVVVQYNTQDPSCSKDVGKAVNAMFALLENGGKMRVRRNTGKGD